MSYERTVTAAIPKPARGRRWLAAALLEAPDRNGSPGAWKAIEAVPVVNEGDPVPDTITSRGAEHDPGWYRIQWYDDGQNSKWSTPVRIEDGDGASSGRWN